MLFGLAAAVVARFNSIGLALGAGAGAGILVFASVQSTGSSDVGSATMFLVIMVALVGSLPLYMFISALLGWDDGELREFKDAIDLIPAPFRFFGRVIYAVVNLGTSLSPLHNRFPAKLDEDASREAAQLTAAKVQMH